MPESIVRVHQILRVLTVHCSGACGCLRTGRMCSDNVWMVRCKTSRGLLCIQSFPKASMDARLRLYKMVLIFEELAEQVPFALKIHDVVEDKGAVLICSEMCPRGTLCDALELCGCISNMGWLVCEVFFLTIIIHRCLFGGECTAT